MDQSPAEVVDLIVYNVASPKGEHIREYGLRERTNMYPNADLKAVRLCSKALALAATPLLFADLLVFMNLASFKKLLAIANQAEPCRLVRHVNVFPGHFQNATLDKEDYQFKLEHASYGSVYKRYHDTFDDEGRKPVFSAKQVDDGFVGYKELLSEYQSLEPTIPEMWKRAFTSFERLDMVTLGYYDDQAFFEEGMELPYLSPPVLQFFRKTLLPFYGGGIPYLYHPVPADMHVIRAASLCRPKIDCLNLYTWPRGLDFDMLNLSDEDLTIVTGLLRNISTIAFTTPSEVIAGYHHYNTTENQPFQILRSASNLRYLDLYGSSISRPGDFTKSLRECHFGQLHSLGLHGVNVDGKDLVGVVQRHKATLARLELTCVTLVSDSWFNVFTAIRGGPKELSATFLILQNADGFWTAYLDSEDRSALSSILNDYVCKDEPWSEKLPTGLVVDAKDLVDEESVV
ncbi:hypothetical protein G7Y79_00003g009400 [Physcia stellaris]|nr:hypothetical protein G7Y79_00003g009400 [Physcia stellaris]